MVLSRERFSEAVIRRVSPQRTGMEVLNQSFQGCEFADTAFPLTLDRVELFVLHNIGTQRRVFDHSHHWRTGNDFASFIVFGQRGVRGYR
jgi:hypothetical protein